MGEFIDFRHVKEQSSFEPVLAHYGIETTGRGEERRARCPFHDDRKPSLTVNLDRKVFQCFGCAAKGNILEFVAQMEDCDLRGAARVLAECCEIGLSAREGETRRAEKPQEGRKERRSIKDTRRGKKAPGGRKKASREVNEPLSFTLPLDAEHPWLADRGLAPELVEEFGLGYYGGRGGLSGRICIPIHNEKGELVAYCGRWPEDEVPEGERKYLLPERFLKSRVVFNLHRLNGAGHAVLVESYFSVFRLHALGVPVVSTMGTSVSEEQGKLLRAAGISSCTVLLDGDEAGHKAGEKMVADLARSFFVHWAEVPRGTKPHNMDEGELAKLVELPGA